MSGESNAVPNSIIEDMAVLLTDENIPVEGILLSVVLRIVDAEEGPQKLLSTVREILERLKELVDQFVDGPAGLIANGHEPFPGFLQPLPDHLHRWRHLGTIVDKFLAHLRPRAK